MNYARRQQYRRLWRAAKRWSEVRPRQGWLSWSGASEWSCLPARSLSLRSSSPCTRAIGVCSPREAALARARKMRFVVRWRLLEARAGGCGTRSHGWAAGTSTRSRSRREVSGSRSRRKQAGMKIATSPWCGSRRRGCGASGEGGVPWRSARAVCGSPPRGPAVGGRRADRLDRSPRSRAARDELSGRERGASVLNRAFEVASGLSEDENREQTR